MRGEAPQLPGWGGAGGRQGGRLGGFRDFRRLVRRGRRCRGAVFFDSQDLPRATLRRCFFYRAEKMIRMVWWVLEARTSSLLGSTICTSGAGSGLGRKKPHAACKRMEPFKQVDCWITCATGEALGNALRAALGSRSAEKSADV